MVCPTDPPSANVFHVGRPSAACRAHNKGFALRSDGLDWVIDQARESRVRLILTLTDWRGDYGGMPEYVRAVLGNRGTVTDFYTSRVVRVRTNPCSAKRLAETSSLASSALRELHWSIAILTEALQACLSGRVVARCANANSHGGLCDM